MTPEAEAAVQREIGLYRQMQGVDSAAMITRSQVAEVEAERRRLKLAYDYAVARAEKAEQREAQFSKWWADVSKQLADVKRQAVQEDWSRAESCDTHGAKLKELDAAVQRLTRLASESERGRVEAVTDIHLLRQQLALATGSYEPEVDR